MTNSQTVYIEFRQRLMNPAVVAVFLAIPVVVLNILPRVYWQGHASHDDGWSSAFANGEAHYGWPNTAKINTIISKAQLDSQMQSSYSINHLLGRDESAVQTTRFSMSVFVANTAFSFSSILLLMLVYRVTQTRMTTLRVGFVVLTTVAIMLVTINCETSL